jgi:peptide chain release factor 2
MPAQCSKNSPPGSTMPGGSFDVDGKSAEIEALRVAASAPDLWTDPDNARRVTRRLSSYEAVLSQVVNLEASLEDAGLLLQLAQAEDDSSALSEVDVELESIQSELGTLERAALFFGDYDDRTAILSIHAGAGGVDAQDWAQMLLRMYTRFLERSDFEFEIDEVSPGEEAGLKSVTLTVRGDHAYGNFEGERGTHRLVRISPFDAAARRHTSFAGVDVIPEVEVAEVEINSDDLRIETFRSQGAGGQHVNVTDSAVRITHLPTRVVVSCQAERSQLQNRSRAMQLLAARLAVVARGDQLKELDAIRGEQTEAGWGRQIRSYVLQPYQIVKDLRTDFEVGNVQGVLDGDIEALMDSYLHWRRELKEKGS